MATETKPRNLRHEARAETSSEIEQRQSEVDKIAADIFRENEHEEDAKKLQKPIPRPVGVNRNSKILWAYVIPVIVFHLLIPLAFIPYFFSWWGLLFLPIGNYIFTSMGIGAGYHRLLTHRGFKCPKWFEYTLTTLGVLSFQDSPGRWVLVHRVHHQHSDHQPDPHTPMVDGFWAHMGWLFVENQSLSTSAAYDRYVRDIIRDKYYLWLQRGLNWVWVYAAHALVFAVVGGLVGLIWTQTWPGSLRLAAQWLMWGVIMRTIFTWHVTWGINSAAHMWGYRNYETRENSRNNWLFALLTNGEGWHNNHHADPRSAAHGHRWWEFDVTYWTLCGLEKIGLIKDLVRPNKSALNRKAIATANGAKGDS